ncbi:hypothetical protein AJ80_09918, partial [Polytolypa hystricis UAMH7299]
MPVFTRILSIALRVGEVAFGAVVAGIVGSYLHKFNSANEWPQARWIYTEVIAGISILLGLIWLIPFSGSFTTWPIDIILSLAWFAAFGLLVNSLNNLQCGRAFDWNNFLDDNICSRWKAANAFSFLSAIFWLVSAILGLWFVYRTRNRRAVAGDGVGGGR